MAPHLRRGRSFFLQSLWPDTRQPVISRLSPLPGLSRASGTAVQSFLLDVGCQRFAPAAAGMVSEGHSRGLFFFEYLFILICNFIFSCNNKVYILCTFAHVLQVLPAERKTDVSRGTSAIGAVPHLLSHPFRSRIRQLPLSRPESRRSSDRRDRPGYAGENACTEYGSEIQGPFRAALCQDILTQRKHPISCAARSGAFSFLPGMAPSWPKVPG